MRPAAVAVLALLALVPPAPAQTADAWRSRYAGAEATGPHVLGLWSFEPDAVEPARDFTNASLRAYAAKAMKPSKTPLNMGFRWEVAW